MGKYRKQLHINESNIRQNEEKSILWWQRTSLCIMRKGRIFFWALEMCNGKRYVSRYIPGKPIGTSHTLICSLLIKTRQEGSLYTGGHWSGWRFKCSVWAHTYSHAWIQIYPVSLAVKPGLVQNIQSYHNYSKKLLPQHLKECRLNPSIWGTFNTRSDPRVQKKVSKYSVV